MDDVAEYLGPVKLISETKARTATPGVAMGLAWTPTGGDILFIESTQMAGKGELKLTGSLGDVMKESAEAALSWLRANADTGEERWRIELFGPTWASPVIVDDVWIQGDCGGTLHAFDVSDTTVEPTKLWEVELGGCIESTPALWNGKIIVGTRSGFVYAVG